MMDVHPVHIRWHHIQPRTLCLSGCCSHLSGSCLALGEPAVLGFIASTTLQPFERMAPKTANLGPLAGFSHCSRFAARVAAGATRRPRCLCPCYRSPLSPCARGTAESRLGGQWLAPHLPSQPTPTPTPAPAPADVYASNPTVYRNNGIPRAFQNPSPPLHHGCMHAPLQRLAVGRLKSHCVLRTRPWPLTAAITCRYSPQFVSSCSIPLPLRKTMLGLSNTTPQ